MTHSGAVEHASDSTTTGTEPTASAPRARRWLVPVLVVLAVAWAYAGYRLFWFLTDDAFIAFRYVSNEIAGHGLVWNPAPFRPVEGYTSFSWVALLDIVWRLTGVAPPEAANPMAFVAGLGTLAVTALMLQRMALPGPMERARLALTVAAFVGILSNRTFLTWLSSGLETSLFNCLVVSWFYVMTSATLDARRTRWLAGIAAALALTRPDGLLFASATVVRVLLQPAPGLRHRALGCLHLWPLLAIGVHVGWRLSFYGEWFPNTYYAKYVAAWPQGGLRYLASFALEYGVWVWLALAVLWAVGQLRRGGVVRRGWRARHAVIAVGAIAAHAGYYTLIIGGDHFEYRVYSQLVPLLWVSGVFFAAWVAPTVKRSAAVIALALVVSWPIAWVHWDATRALETRKETFSLKMPIADRFPAPIRPVVEVWDELQHWLIERGVGVRRKEHSAFHEMLIDRRVSRADGAKITWEQRAVITTRQVGVTGWVLPGVAVIDGAGLNDYVVARQPVNSKAKRRMAHDRWAPKGYVECFKPNVRLIRRGVRVKPRPLTDAQIHACERWSIEP